MVNEFVKTVNARHWQLCIRYLKTPYQAEDLEPLSWFEPLHLFDWPEAWAWEYQRNNFLGCDPFLVQNRLKLGEFQEHQQTKALWADKRRNSQGSVGDLQMLSEQTVMLVKLELIKPLQQGYSIGSVTPGGPWEGYFALHASPNTEGKIYPQPLLELVSPSILEAAKTIFCNSMRDQLTARQKLILGLLSQGWSKIEIASHLELSADTVAEHVQNVFLTLKVKKLGEAVTIAANLKLF